MLAENEIVASLIREVGLERLMNWDGCCCGSFSIRNVNVDVSCGKSSREQAVWLSSRSLDYSDEALLKPIMAEIIEQLTEKSSRGRPFKQYFHEWIPT